MEISNVSIQYAARAYSMPVVEVIRRALISCKFTICGNATRPTAVQEEWTRVSSSYGHEDRRQKDADRSHYLDCDNYHDKTINHT